MRMNELVDSDHESSIKWVNHESLFGTFLCILDSKTLVSYDSRSSKWTMNIFVENSFSFSFQITRFSSISMINRRPSKSTIHSFVENLTTMNSLQVLEHLLLTFDSYARFDWTCKEMKYQSKFDSNLLNKSMWKGSLKGFLVKCDTLKRVRNWLHLLIRFFYSSRYPFFTVQYLLRCSSRQSPFRLRKFESLFSLHRSRDENVLRHKTKTEFLEIYRQMVTLLFLYCRFRNLVTEVRLMKKQSWMLSVLFSFNGNEISTHHLYI